MKHFFRWLSSQDESGETPSKLSHKRLKYYQDLRKVWRESANLDLPQSPDVKEEWNKLFDRLDNEEPRPLSSFSKWYWYPAVASVLILFIYLCFGIYRPHQNTFITNQAEQKTLVLPDGSKVVLNSGSRIEICSNFSETSRDVFLQGEAYFDVVSSEIPFVVDAAIASVHVVGTEFNLRSRDRKVELAVNEGVVTITGTSNVVTQSVSCQSGYYCVCYAGQNPELPQKIRFKNYPGWLHGDLTFHDTTVREVCDDIVRMFDVQIRINDVRLKNTTINGLLKADSAHSAISSLCLLTEKEFRFEEGVYVIF